MESGTGRAQEKGLLLALAGSHRGLMCHEVQHLGQRRKKHPYPHGVGEDVHPPEPCGFEPSEDVDEALGSLF